jgi:hypothetical protein
MPEAAVPGQLAAAQAAAAAEQLQLDARLAAAEEGHRRELAAATAAHKAIVDQLTAQLAEAQRQGAASERQVCYSSV